MPPHLTPSSPVDRTEPALPELRLCLADGDVLVVGAPTASTTLAEVIARAGLGRPVADEVVTIDGRRVPAGQTLVRCGIRRGSTLDVRPGVSCVPAEIEAWRAVWISGPDAGGSVGLGRGEHLVGRATTAKMRCDDRALELHHAVIEVGADGTASVTQLAGLHPVVLDGVAIDGRVIIRSGRRMEIGASVLVLRRVEPPQPSDACIASPAARSAVAPGLDPWREPWLRVPRQRFTFEPETLEAPRPARAGGGFGGGLVPALIGVVAAGAMALIFGQVMFLLFGAMGAVVALGSWLAQRFGLIRSRRSAGRSDASSFAAFVTALDRQRAEALLVISATTPTIDRAIAAIVDRTADLWSVRPADSDAFVVSVGEGDGSWRPQISGVVDVASGSPGGSFDVRGQLLSAIDSASRLGIVPITASLAAGSIVAVVGGDEALAVVRSMIVQLAAASGPADWRPALVTDRRARWLGIDWLTQSCGSGPSAVVDGAGAREMMAAIDLADERHLLLVLDGADQLTNRTGPARRLLAESASAACIVLCPTEADVPVVCTSMLVVGRNGRGRWIADARASTLAETVRIAGVSAGRANSALASIAALTDPELVDDASGLPEHVGVIELLAADIGTSPHQFARRIASRWRDAGWDSAASAPIGIAADGTVEIDLGRDGPHGLVAGTTGAGKSELLRSLVIGLAARSSPEQITFVLIDYKGGSTFDACADLPHTVGLVTDLDDRLAGRALRSLEAELRRRERLLRAVGANDLGEYRDALADRRATTVLPRAIVVIDEFAGLAIQQPDFIGALLGIAQRGRSLGVHLLLATQRPTGVVDDDIRANSNLRIALRVHDASDSTDVIGVPLAARLPRSIPGRAVLRLGADDPVCFQTACCTQPVRGDAAAGSLSARIVRADEMGSLDVATVDVATVDVAPPGSGPDQRLDGRRGPTELEVLVEAICSAATASGFAPPHRPWLEPLSAETGLDSIPFDELSQRPEAGDALGVADDPDHQTRRPLTWGRGDGNLLLVESPGSGTTTTLLTIAASLDGPGGHDVDSGAADELFVIDADGDARLDAVSHLSTCAAVVRLHERERLMRVLGHLVRLIDGRRSTLDRSALDGATSANIVVLIDGFDALRAALDADEQWSQLEQLGRIIGEGRAAGIRVVMTTNRAASVPSSMLGLFGRRWVFHLDDPLEIGILGLKASVVPRLGSPGRLHDSESGCEAQIVAWTPTTAAAPIQVAQPARHPHLRRLGDDIDLGAVPDRVRRPVDGEVALPIGLGFDDLGPATLIVPAGEHVLVLGPSRSGRSTTLAAIAERWSRANEHCAGVGSESATVWVGCIAPRRSSAVVGTVCADVPELLGRAPAGVPVLVVIDDAELVDDPTGALASRITRRDESFTVVAAGRAESLRASYGHWTTAVRRSRLGLVMSAADELDGDLLGVLLPRRLPVPARPGLAWLVADGDRRLMQVGRVLDAVGALP